MPIKQFSPLVLLFFVNSATAAVTFYSVNDYRGRDDNPFINNPSIEVAYLQDFETQFQTASNKLTTPYATGWNGGTTGGARWGVQEDYTETDGTGYTWSDNIVNPDWRKQPTGIHFDFTPDEYGRYPEYVGAALRGFGMLGGTAGFNAILVYDATGNEITAESWLIAKPVPDPDQSFEELFLNFEGIYVPGGISKIQFRDFTDVDHLTYGYSPIPEPATVRFAGLAAASLLGRRTRRRIA